MSKFKGSKLPSWMSPELAEAISKHGKTVFGPSIKPSPELAKVISSFGVWRAPISDLNADTVSIITSHNFLRKTAEAASRSGLFVDQFGFLRSRKSIPGPRREITPAKKKMGPPTYNEDEIITQIWAEYKSTGQSRGEIIRKTARTIKETKIAKLGLATENSIVRRLERKLTAKYGSSRPRAGRRS